ncbi:hypothetical protein [Streptomyces sp. NPDC002403]
MAIASCTRHQHFEGADETTLMKGRMGSVFQFSYSTAITE